MISFTFLLSAQSFGQSIGDETRGGLCLVCNDSKNNIQVNGENEFIATQAQDYYWEICDGPATIDGSNENQEVTITGPAGTTSKIRLIRFKDGNCSEYCEVFTIPQEDPPSCDFCQLEITIVGNTSGGFCEQASVTLSGCDQPNNIVEVIWSYALAGTDPQCGPYPYGCPLSGTNTGVLFTVPQDLELIQDQYLELHFHAEVRYDDGTTVCVIEAFQLLICDQNYEDGPGGGLNINIYPNPSKKGDQIAFDGVDFKNISSIEVLDLTGNTKLNTKPKRQSFNIDNLTQGVYIVKFTTATNEIIQKKLVVE